MNLFSNPDKTTTNLGCQSFRPSYSHNSIPPSRPAAAPTRPLPSTATLAPAAPVWDDCATDAVLDGIVMFAPVIDGIDMPVPPAVGLAVVMAMPFNFSAPAVIVSATVLMSLAGIVSVDIGASPKLDSIQTISFEAILQSALAEMFANTIAKLYVDGPTTKVTEGISDAQSLPVQPSWSVVAVGLAEITEAATSLKV